MKKLVAITLLSVVLLFSLVSKEYAVSSEHFDFIYTDETVETAREIIEVAEDYYSNLVSFFGVDPEMHIPVYFKYDTKSYNAYFTSYPSNHIVMFVTSIPTSLFLNVDYPLALTFYHELTHAFTHNIKSGFTRFLSNVFGDPISPADLFYMNKAFTEGIAVYVESMNGEGRLNDEKSLYLVNQMSAENLDIYYLDIEGSRDRSPGGNMSYILGGAFLKYLGETYGEEKVASLIVSYYKFPISTTELIFKKNFGISLKDAWSDFVISSTVEKDLVEPETITGWGGWYNLRLNGSSLYVENASKSGLYRINDDNSTKRIKLTASSFDDLSFSDSYYLLPYVSTSSRSVSVVTMAGKEVRSFDDYFTGLLLSDSRVLLVTEEDRNTRIDLRDIESGELISSYALGRDITLSSGVAFSSSNALFLFSQGGRTYVLSLDTGSGDMKKIEFDESISINSIAMNSDSTISFSYITREKGTFMKYGVLRRDGNEWVYKLSDDEYNGGIYYPVKKDGTVYFVSKFFSGSRVSVLDYSSLHFEEEKKALISDVSIRVNSEKVEIENALSYNPFRYMRKGFLLPAASFETKILGEKSGLGLNYKIADPTEAHTFVMGAGYNFEKKSPFGYFNYQYKDYFSASLMGLYKDQKWSAEIDLTGTYTKTFSSDSRYLSLSDTVAGALMENNKFEAKNYLTLTYQDSYSLGYGRHENLGWAGQIGLENLTPTAAVALYVPRILPIESTYRMAYNIPFKVVFAVKDYKNPILKPSADLYLFTYEVQSSIRFLYLYVRNVDVVFSYSGELPTETMKYSDTYTLKLSIGLSPTLGTLAQIPIYVNLGVKYDREKTKVSFLFKLGD